MRHIFFCCTLIAAASAHGANCNTPPYGASIRDYTAYEDSFESTLPAAKLFAGICRAKFEGGDRTALHKLLGLTDAQIDNTSVGDLAIQMLKAMWQLAHQTDPPPQ